MRDRQLRLSGATPYLFLAPAILLLLIFVFLPLVQTFYYSLFRWSSIDPTLHFVGLENFVRIFSDKLVGRGLINNVWYAVGSLAFQVYLALVLAAVLESGLVGNRIAAFFRSALFLPSVLAVTVVGVAWQLLYQPEQGLVNQLLGAMGLESLARPWLGSEKTAIFSVIAVSQWQYTGYSMLLFLVAIQAIPKELYEAATIDGANRIQQFFSITVPGVRETTLVLVSITVIGAFKVFDIIWVMTGGGPNHASQVLGTYLYRAGFRDDEMGYASALATILFAITFVLTAVQMRLRRGGKGAVR